MHFKDKPMRNLVVVLVCVLIVVGLGCNSLSDHAADIAEENGGEKHVTLNLTVTDENSSLINRFTLKVNDEKPIEALNGKMNLSLEPGNHRFAIKADGRLPKHIKYSLLGGSCQKLDVFLPSLHNKAYSYPLDGGKENVVGFINDDAEWGLNVRFPLGSLSVNGKLVMYPLTTESEEEYFSNRPGEYELKRGGKVCPVNSLLSSYFMLKDEKGNKMQLFAPAEISFKILGSLHPDNLYVAAFNDEESCWEKPQPVTYDPETKIYSAQVNHFSWYDLVQPIEPDVVKKITVKVASFVSDPSATPAKPLTPREDLLAQLSLLFKGKDAEGKDFVDDSMREKRKEELMELLREAAEGTDIEALKEEAKNYTDVPSYQVNDEANYQQFANQVKDAIVEIKSIKRGVAVRRERVLTDQNGLAEFQVDPEATYFYLKVVHKLSDTKVIVAAPEVMQVNELSEGIVHVNLSEYPEFTIKDGTLFF